MDSKGRIIISRRIRKEAQLKEGSYIKIGLKGKTITLEPVEPVADKYFGAFKVAKWPEDVDEFLVKIMQK